MYMEVDSTDRTEGRKTGKDTDGKEEMRQRSVCLKASAAQCSDTAYDNRLTAIYAVEGYMQARQALIESAHTGKG